MYTLNVSSTMVERTEPKALELKQSGGAREAPCCGHVWACFALLRPSQAMLCSRATKPLDVHIVLYWYWVTVNACVP